MQSRTHGGSAPAAGEEADVGRGVAQRGLDRVFVVMAHRGRDGPRVEPWVRRGEVEAAKHEISAGKVLRARAWVDSARAEAGQRAHLDERTGGRTVPEHEQQRPRQGRLEKNLPAAPRLA